MWSEGKQAAHTKFDFLFPLAAIIWDIYEALHFRQHMLKMVRLFYLNHFIVPNIKSERSNLARAVVEVHASVHSAAINAYEHAQRK